MSRRATAAAALGAALALATAACGGPAGAAGALRSTEAKLDDVTSGEMTLRLLASPSGGSAGAQVGFELEGPFAVGKEKGSLPTADLRFTRVTGDTRRTTRFISTGSRAFLEVDGAVTELSERQVSELRVRDGAKGGGLEGISVARWIDDPTMGPGPSVGGAATDRITGTADPIAILNDLARLSERFGAGGAVRPLDGDAADRVRRAVSAASAEVVTGRDDRLLRRAAVTVELAVSDARVREALGDLAGARLSMELDLRRLNEPVEVATPTAGNKAG